MKTLSLFIVSLLTCTYLYSVNISPKFASLTAKGPSVKISVTQDKKEQLEIVYSPNIIFLKDSTVIYPHDFSMQDTKAWVAVNDLTNDKTDTCFISIVPWKANISELKIIKSINERYAILGKTEDTLFVDYKNKLYKTGGDLSTLMYLSDFEVKRYDFYWGFLKTPAGYFIRKENDIYFSLDERKWIHDYTTRGRGVRNSFAFTYDSISQTTNIFTHDYTVAGQDTFPHSIYRKTITPTQNNKWEKVFTFFSKDQWAIDKSLFPACRHVHTVVVDPYTGHLWMGTGDLNPHSHIYYSDDNGTTWKHIGMGSQEWRVLSIWFTAGYVYWSMDTSASPQKIFRISRKIYDKFGFWPDMTPKISNGVLNQGVHYLISSLTTDNYYSKIGAKIGDIVIGNTKAAANDSNVVYSIDDPTYDYRELVALLPNNALWAHVIVYDQHGDEVTLLSANAEGQAIDNRPRIFGIKELADSSVEVQELLSTNSAKNLYSQFYPYEQDALGNIYFQAYEMNAYAEQGLIQTKLNWKNSDDIQVGTLGVEDSKDTDVLLSLSGCEADSLTWQMSSEKKLKWSTVPDVNKNQLALRVSRDSVKTMLYRVLIYMKGNPPSTSNFVKVEKLPSISDVKKTKVKPHSIESSIVSNGGDKYLVIKCYDTIPESLDIELFDFSGRLVYTDSHAFSQNSVYEMDLNSLNGGMYVLRIYGKKDYLISKLVF